MNGLFVATSVLLIGALVFGGSARFQGYLDLIPLLLALPALVIALWQLGRPNEAWSAGVLFAIGVTLAPLVQLIPLPPAVWTSLPYRDLIADAQTVSGSEIGWRSLSLTPVQTALTFLSLVPPLALFFATLNLTLIQRRWLIMIMVGWGVAASLLGLLQVAQGQPDWLVALGFKDSLEASATFANRNHFAALLYCLLVFASCFVIDRLKELPSGVALLRSSRPLAWALAGFVVLVIILSGLIMARSRAGIILTILALVGIAAMAGADKRSARTGARRVIAVAAALVLLFASQYGLYRLLDRFEADPLEDARLAFARNTWDAAMAFMPWGSGLGSFVPVYQMLEPTKDALPDRFANRAHNDFLEVWLETGIIGLILMALFGWWLIRSLWQVWRPKEEASPTSEPVDQLIVRAASLVLLLLLAHALVDYALRTTALAAVFAVSCGLLFPARALAAQHARGAKTPWDHRDGVPASPRERTSTHRWSPYAEAGFHQEGATASTGPDMDRNDPAPAKGQITPDWGWPVPTSGPAETKTSPTQPADDARVVGSETRKKDAPAGLKPGQRWGSDVTWPEAWTKATRDRSSQDDKT